MSDVTKKLRQRDGDRGQRGDTEDRGQREERVVDIYESVNDIVSGPQLDMRDNTAGRHSQGELDKVLNRQVGFSVSESLLYKHKALSLPQEMFIWIIVIIIIIPF